MNDVCVCGWGDVKRATFVQVAEWVGHRFGGFFHCTLEYMDLWCRRRVRSKLLQKKMGSDVKRRVTARRNTAPKGQRPAATGPDVRFHATRITRRSLLVRQDLLYCKIKKMRHAHLPLKQRQPKRAAGATMLMLSGLWLLPAIAKEPLRVTATVFAIPLCTPLHIWHQCVGVGEKKKPTASYLFTLKSALLWTKRTSWT